MKDSSWAHRRRERAILHNARREAGEVPQPAAEVVPGLATLLCGTCRHNHFAARCKRLMCSRCCKAQPGGFCSWHLSNAEALQRVRSQHSGWQ